MTIHSELPIHKTVYDLLCVATEAMRNMPRDVKQLIGGKIRDELLEAFDSIYLANRARQKEPHILSVHKHILKAEILLRMSRDLGLVKTPAYAKAVKLSQSIGRQTTGWRQSEAARHSPVT